MFWSAESTHPLHNAIEVLAKGQEIKMPNGMTFFDTDAQERAEIRAAWWKADAQTWRDIAICVPDPERQLPDAKLPASIRAEVYPTHEKPVFFGHYWLEGDFVLQAQNALCLDYSAGKKGPLISYMSETGSRHLDLNKITVF